MKITSKLIKPKNENNDVDFPLLSLHTPTGQVVYFTNNTTGVVLVKGEGIDTYDVGTRRNDWTFGFNDSYWKVLPPGTKIEISVS